MSEFKDKIPAAGGKVEFLYDPATGGISNQISGTGFMALYFVAVSPDGRRLLCTVPAGGIGHTVTYPQPSVLTCVQSDQQGMWGRNCPACKKYFRTDHIMGQTCCPYCTTEADSLAFISKDQLRYITACYDAFARAYVGKISTAVDLAAVTDGGAAWHYSEEKQQFHFRCRETDCDAQTDMLGQYGYCPRCGRTNARKLFAELTDEMLGLLQKIKDTVSDRKERTTHWEGMTIKSLSDFESVARHLRVKLLRLPMTKRRKRQLEALSFLKPLQADTSLMQWFDIGFLEWVGDETAPKRQVPESDLPFIKKMIQKRHVFMHNGGIVDQEYLELSGDSGVRLGERITVRSQEAKRFIGCVRTMGENFLDNVEYGIQEGDL